MTLITHLYILMPVHPAAYSCSLIACQVSTADKGGGRTPSFPLSHQTLFSSYWIMLTLPYLSSPALSPGSGDERRVTAHHGRVLHEHAVRERLVRGELDHLQPEPRPQDLDVSLLLLHRLGQVHLRLAAPQRFFGQGHRDSPNDGVGVMTETCHQTSHVLRSLYLARSNLEKKNTLRDNSANEWERKILESADSIIPSLLICSLLVCWAFILYLQ